MEENTQLRKVIKGVEKNIYPITKSRNVTFSDGETLQQKYDSGDMSGGNSEELKTHIANTTVHINASERIKWNGMERKANDYTDNKIGSLINTAPEALDTLKELSDALGNDPNFSTTVMTEIGKKAPTSHASNSNIHGISSATLYGHAMASSATPLVAGSSSAGIDNGKYAREGHVHPAQTSVSGNAGTATKLQTTRQINGTNFDGASNITTANWGTARTLTIGNSSKSVNGSGNIAWSLGEIGALPLTGGSLTGQLDLINKSVNPSFGTTKTGNDTADSFPSGLSIFQSNDSINGWGSAYGTILNVKSGGGNTRQFQLCVTGSGDKTMTFRSSHSNNTSETKWGEWNRIYHTGNKPTLSELGALASNANAVSASKLATARTINGTAFDGTANVTTSNWGTGRTLTIGNTGKTVNGSGNISWSLSEIGASELNHNHDNLYLKLSGGTINGSLNISQYLKLNAWSGYGSGSINIWADRRGEGVVDIDGAKDIKLDEYYVYHTGRKPSLEELGASDSNHNHNSVYAPLDSGAGSWLSSYAISDISNKSLKTCFRYSNSSAVGKPEGTDHALLTMAYGETWKSQFAQDWRTNHAYIRACNNGTWTSWAKLYTTINKPTAADVGARPNNWVPAWGDVTGKPSTYAPIIGTASNQAAAGNHNHDSVYLGKTSNAVSASKLSTPRTINGTNFDGTANITITASANGGTSTATSYMNVNNTETKNAGRLQMFQTSGNTTMMPDSGWWSLLRMQHSGYTNGYWQEIATSFASDTVRFRRNVNGVIGSWKTFAFTDSSITGNSATATTLQNTRTINGTNFNGSANITTANWGTARNLQIGNTAKSVNGSANVTWSLSEIGALASNANAVSATKLQTARTINGTSFDGTANITITAAANGGTSTLTNGLNVQDIRDTAPSPDSFAEKKVSAFFNNHSSYGGSWHSGITVGGWTGGYQVWQISAGSTSSDNEHLYFRRGRGTAWGSLRKIYHEGFKPTASDVGARPNSWVPTWNDISGKPSTFAPSSHNHTSLSSVTTIDGVGGGGSYGSLDIGGAKGGWAGIRFTGAANTTLMVRASDGYMGMYRANGSWIWSFDHNGVLVTGSVPWDKVTGKPSTFAPIIGSASNQAAAGNHNHDASYLGKTATATAATKLATARQINGVNFDGTANINIPIASHNHDSSYLKTTGGTLTGGLTISTDSILEWSRNTDWAKIGFKNTGDSDADSYMYFDAGDNGNEYFKFRSTSGSTTTDLLTIKTDHARFKGNAIYHQGYKPSAGDIGAAPASHSHNDATWSRLHLTNWLYLKGNTGIYFDAHGGGIFMEDNYWVKVYAGKAFYCSSELRGRFITCDTHISCKNGESLFCSNGSYVDAWNGTACAAKFSGSVGVSDDIRVGRYIYGGNVESGLQSCIYPTRRTYAGSNKNFLMFQVMDPNNGNAWEDAMGLTTEGGNEIGFSAPIYPSEAGGYNLGGTNYRWKTAYLVNSPSVSSDFSMKNNISYIDGTGFNSKKSYCKLDKSDIKIRENDCRSFIKEMRFATYYYNNYEIDKIYGENERGEKAVVDTKMRLVDSTEEDFNIGFIAQDLLGTKVGNAILTENDNGELAYNTGSYTSTIAIALQEEIKIRDEEIYTLKARLSKIEAMLGI